MLHPPSSAFEIGAIIDIFKISANIPCFNNLLQKGSYIFENNFGYRSFTVCAETPSTQTLTFFLQRQNGFLNIVYTYSEARFLNAEWLYLLAPTILTFQSAPSSCILSSLKLHYSQVLLFCQFFCNIVKKFVELPIVPLYESYFLFLSVGPWEGCRQATVI